MFILSSGFIWNAEKKLSAFASAYFRGIVNLRVPNFKSGMKQKRSIHGAGGKVTHLNLFPSDIGKYIK